MPDELPTGTVTFLFTDVEESTRLLAELGSETYAEVLRSHRDVIRDALAAHEGIEVDTQGDAFFCAFASARAAVACADSVQSALNHGPVKVRIGIHTGEAQVADRHYVGMDVHRAARIGACGHGGQVVISSSTVGLLEPGSFPLKDLGAHRLKDLSAPVTLYQLGATEFAPLKTLFRTNLPVPATPFLGRETELREVVERALGPAVRLLTLVGPGGTGKTRFALQLAAELADAFPDGVRWAPLASLRDPALVASAVAQAVEVEEGAGEPLAEAVSRALVDERLLLLVDNCEHLLDAAARIVSPIVGSCPGVFVLTTSREPLAVAGEHVYHVEPLPSADAVTLFEERARAAGAALDSTEAGRSAIELLCSRLDNLPLAVELAAARAGVLPPAALLERLASRIDLLKGPRDADERQRTLRSTIAWSYDLLEPGEQDLLRRISVLAGGGSLQALETICGGDLEEILSLVAKSLVRQSERAGGEPRYWMLETIREFALELLAASGEEDAYRGSHLAWFAGLARDAAGGPSGPGLAERYEGLEADLENLRAAFALALASGQDEAVVSLAVVLGPLHILHGRYAEGEETVRAALALSPPLLDAAFLSSRLGRVLRQRVKPDEALEAHREAVRILESTEVRDAAWWTTWIDVKLYEAHHYYFEADLLALERLIDDVRMEVERHGSPEQGLDFLHVVAQHRYRRERYALSDETEALAREIYRRSRELGVAQSDYADFTLGFALLWREKFGEAESAFQRGLTAARARENPLIEARCLVYALVSHRRRGDVEGARELLAELSALEDLQGYSGLVKANESWLASRDGDTEAAVRHAEAAIADWSSRTRSGPTVFQWTARFPLLGVELARGRLEVATDHARAMLQPSQQALPPELESLLARAVEDRDEASLERALEWARASGHA